MHRKLSILPLLLCLVPLVSLELAHSTECPVETRECPNGLIYVCRSAPCDPYDCQAQEQRSCYAQMTPYGGFGDGTSCMVQPGLISQGCCLQKNYDCQVECESHTNQALEDACKRNCALGYIDCQWTGEF